MRTFNLFPILGASFALLVACAEKEIAENPDDGPEEPASYGITAPSSEDYIVQVQEIAEEGEEVPVYVTLKEGSDLKVTSVSFNESPCEFVSEDNLVYSYKFEMPSEDVEISVETSRTAFSISWEDGKGYGISCGTSKADPGTEVTLTVTVTDLRYRPAAVSYGSSAELCEQVGDPSFAGNDATKGPLSCDYSFTMPERDVEISVELDEALNRISRTSDENADIWMLNRLYPDGYNPDIEEGIENEYDQKVCMGMFEDQVFFRILSKPGYKYETPQVQGTITGNTYVPEYVNHQVHGWCYSVIMPAEPLDITVSVTEENKYEDKEFIGTYNGFWIKVRSGSLIYQPSEPTLTYELRKNTTYTVTSVDENNFSGLGFYSFNEETGEFAYDYDAMKANLETQNTTTGLSGSYGKDVTLAVISNIEDQKPDNTRYYVAAKGEGTASITDFVSASSTSGLTILMSFRLNGTLCYYWYDHSNTSLSPVDVEFGSGSSLADDGASAYVRLDGQVILKYSVADGIPVFATKGSEAGTYAGSSGNLVLDGFGNATLDGVAGTYELDGTTLIFTDSSSVTTEFLLDVNDHTYTVVSDTGVWDGPMTFSAESPDGLVGGARKKALVALYLGGSYVHFQFAFDNYGNWADEINTAISYVYDAQAQLLTISFLNFSGKPTAIEQGDGAYPSLSHIVFKVSPDKRSLEFTGIDTLYGRWNTNSLPLDGVVLEAVE